MVLLSGPVPFEKVCRAGSCDASMARALKPRRSNLDSESEASFVCSFDFLPQDVCRRTSNLSKMSWMRMVNQKMIQDACQPNMLVAPNFLHVWFSTPGRIGVKGDYDDDGVDDPAVRLKAAMPLPYLFNWLKFFFCMLE